jgi:DNA-directed RNA polymerase subunit RPC12/RpoP
MMLVRCLDCCSRYRIDPDKIISWRDVKCPSCDSPKWSKTLVPRKGLRSAREMEAQHDSVTR